MKNKPLHYLLVGLQFFALLIAAAFGQLFPINWWVILMYAVALIVAFTAVYSMKLHTITALPMPREGSKLCKKGPYKFLRHPMYSSLILIMLALLLTEFTWPRMFAGILLIIVVTSKVFIEEKALKQKFDEYELYMKKTWALVPFIF